MIELENVFKPKKRVFVSLTLASAVIGAMVIYMAWRVALPGLEQSTPSCLWCSAASVSLLL